MRTGREAFAPFTKESMISILTFIVATAAGLMTFFVSFRVFRDQFKLGPPGLMAAAVAGLAFLGLMSQGQGLIAAILIPYAALGLTLLLLFLLFWIVAWMPSSESARRRYDSILRKLERRSHRRVDQPARMGAHDKPRATGIREVQPPK